MNKSDTIELLLKAFGLALVIIAICCNAVNKAELDDEAIREIE